MKRQPESDREVQRGFDRIAASYDRRWPRYQTDTTRETLARVAPGDADAVLDIGCGTGTLLEELARRRGPTAPRSAGVDLSRGMLAEAGQKLGPRALLAAGDAMRLPFRTGIFDVALSVSALHHWADPAAVLGEARRVLRPGGRLVITDWCGDRWLERLRTRFLRRRHRGHLRVYRSAELENLLATAGYHDVRIERWRSGWRWSLMTATARAE